MSSADVAAAAAAALGTKVLHCERIRGGDIATALRVRTPEGPVLVKTRPDAGPSDFEVEAAGLRWLAEAAALRTPEVLAVGDAPAPYLVLEWIEPGAPAADHDERLGRGLADLHRFGAPGFGLDHDNLIGSLPQPNAACPDWPTFYGERRLAPLADRALAAGRIDAGLRREIDRTIDRLPDLCGPPEPAARLHGDLWGGNVLVDAAGGPVLIDPAVYGGHREIDLAMMRLFGGFSARTFAAYEERAPLAPQWPRRVPLYQLAPLLVHVVLFGGGYVGQLRSALSTLR
jgi:fructosamine-3-kinase